MSDYVDSHTYVKVERKIDGLTGADRRVWEDTWELWELDHKPPFDWNSPIPYSLAAVFISFLLVHYGALFFAEIDLKESKQISSLISAVIGSLCYFYMRYRWKQYSKKRTIAKVRLFNIFKETNLKKNNS